MKDNKYDDESFFFKYSAMPRSKYGLESAGEWHDLKKMLPDFRDKRVLDLGCGFGWHCFYAAEQGAESVTGIDISKKMLEKANTQKNKNITFIHSSIQDYEYPQNAFDVVLSSLVFHYIQSFEDICKKVSKCLVKDGTFIFSVEHPVFTAQGDQDWIYDKKGNPLHWPVDNYFLEGERNCIFLGEKVKKFHRTVSTYFYELTKHNFAVSGFCEPTPPQKLINNAEMKNELRRPMMLIISAVKK